MAVKKKVVEIDTQQATTSVKELRQQLKALKDQMLSTTEGTEEYNQAMIEAANIMHTLKEQNEQLNASAMDFGQITGNVIKATGGLVAGLQAAKATMNLFGVENEAVMESLQKMQSLMAITQALPSLEAGAKAFARLGRTIKASTVGLNGFKKALISTGIGAAVVAVGLLVANWDKLSAVINKSAAAAEAAAKALVDNVKASVDALKGMLTDINKMSDETVSNLKEMSWKDLIDATAAEKVGVSATELVQIHNRYIKALNAGNVELARESKQTLDQLLGNNEQTKAAFENFIKIAQNLNDRAKKAAEDAANEEEEKQKQRKDAYAKAQAELEKLSNSYTAVLNEINLYGKTDQEKEIIKLQEDEAKKVSIVEESLKKKLISTEEAESQIAKIHEHYATLVTEVQNREAEERRKKEEEERQARIDQLKEWVTDAEFNYSTQLEQLQSQQDAELAMLEEAHNNMLLEDERYQALKTDILAKYSEERTALEKQEAENRKNIQMSTMNAYLDIADGFGSILGSLADAMDENNKEQFEAAKAFNISAAVINTITGAISAYTGAAGNPGLNAIPVVGPALAMALGITNATAVAAAGAVQIAKLSQTKFGDKGGASGLKATPSSGAVMSMNAPVQYTQDIQGASIEGAIKDSRVYVTEGDISRTQKRVDVAESEARF